MYDSASLYALNQLAQSHKTRHVKDLAIQAMMLRSARDETELVVIQEFILRARADWLVYLTIQQRKWQCMNTRRPSRARHHDSIAIREKYVRVKNA